MDTLQKRFPAALLAAYFSKILILGASWTDAAVLLILAGSAGFFEAWSHLKSMEATNARIDALELKLKDAEKADQEIRSFLATQKMTQATRPFSVR